MVCKLVPVLSLCLVVVFTSDVQAWYSKRKCVQKLNLGGEECNGQDTVCKEGLFCDTNGICKAVLDVGGHCGGRYTMCKQSLVCHEDHCKRAVAAGGDCTPKDTVCMTGLCCVDGLCSCSYTVRGNNGTILSPYYPERYGDKNECIYTLQFLQEGPQTLEVYFKVNIEDKDYDYDFYDEFAPSECYYDYLELNYDDRLYCGAGSTTRTVLVDGDTFAVKFVSDVSKSRKQGFVLRYTIVGGEAD